MYAGSAGLIRRFREIAKIDRNSGNMIAIGALQVVTSDWECLGVDSVIRIGRILCSS